MTQVNTALAGSQYGAGGGRSGANADRIGAESDYATRSFTRRLAVTFRKEQRIWANFADDRTAKSRRLSAPRFCGCELTFPNNHIGQVKVGQGISLQTSAYPDRNFAGTVVRISPSVNATSRTLTVEAEVENADGLLKPGQFATVRIAQSTPKPAVMIPATAVKTEGDTNRVFVDQGRTSRRAHRQDSVCWKTI